MASRGVLYSKLGPFKPLFQGSGSGKRPPSLSLSRSCSARVAAVCRYQPCFVANNHPVLGLNLILFGGRRSCYILFSLLLLLTLKHSSIQTHIPQSRYKPKARPRRRHQACTGACSQSIPLFRWCCWLFHCCCFGTRASNRTFSSHVTFGPR